MTSEQNLRAPLSGDVALANIIDNLTVEGKLYEKLENSKVHCYACAHHCKIPSGGRGVCQVRYNLGGELRVPNGYVGALQCDPIEKKPFFHLLPGNDALTFGMLGCDLHCAYCQNWDISQSLRDASAGRPPRQITPQALVAHAVNNGAKVIVSSYNEPLITAEWAAQIFKVAREQGLLCAFVSNGNATAETLQFIKPYTQAYKVDLKTMSDKNYRKLGTSLDKVLNGIRMIHKLGFWLEIVTLLIPGFNDSDEEIKDAIAFIKSVSPSIPWHVTAFHKDYRMQEPANTEASLLVKVTEMAYSAGLNFVYPGNLPGRVGPYEHTYCPGCKTPLIQRVGYVVLDYKVTPEGSCPHCQAQLPGIWPKNVNSVKVGTVNDLYRRVPKLVK